MVRLEELIPDYGSERRRLRVMKYRGQPFRGGYHDFIIKTGGVQVFPRLVSAEYRKQMESSVLVSGIAEFDQLLGGGIESGSSTLIIGPAGTGKSLIAVTMAVAAVKRGERAALFILYTTKDIGKGSGLGLSRSSASQSSLVAACGSKPTWVKGLR